MAVQAHYPSNAFAPDFRTDRAPPGGNAVEDRQIGSLVDLYPNLVEKQIVNGAVFSDPQSELTFSKEDAMVLPQSNHPQKPQQISQPFRFTACSQNFPERTIANTSAGVGSGATISTGLQLSYDQNRLQGYAGTSTSGRPVASSLASHLNRHNMEIEALIRLQSQELRLGMEEIRKRQCKELLGMMGQQAAKRIRVKEAELETARWRNVELEARMKQLTAENQIWFDIARNNEVVSSNLKASLEQILSQNAAAAEGYGDSCSAPFPADDAQSLCVAGDEAAAAAASRENQEVQWRKTCKACREKDVSVLLLPCRHLCICQDCESAVDTCPICRSVKNGSLQVFIS